MRRFCLALSAAALLASPAAAQPDATATSPTPAPAPTQPAAAATDALDPDRIVCRNSTVTGSRLAKRRKCRKASEWAAANAANQQSVRELQRPGGLDGNEVFGSSRGPGNLSTGRPQ